MRFWGFFPFFKKIWFLGILGPHFYGIGATIRIGREMLCLPHAGFLHWHLHRLAQSKTGQILQIFFVSTKNYEILGKIS